MAQVLVVDDSPLDRRLTARMLEEIGLQVVDAGDGQAALAQLAIQLPDLVLTDLQMPVMDGLALVKQIRLRHPTVPVILMTAYGSEEIAVKALRSGAASYVPKHTLAHDLVPTVRSVLSIARARRESLAVLDSMTRLESQFVLSNSVEGLDALLGHFKEQLKQMQLFDEADIMRLSTALYEAILNAIEHGNLELESSQRDQEGPYYRRVVEERGMQPPYHSRHIYVTILFTRTAATITVRDEGRGFDPAKLADPTAPENVDKTEGRGLFLIRTFMDEVNFNACGNEITMIKHRTN